MANNTWLGRAQAFAQDVWIEFSNVEVGDRFTVTINDQAITIEATTAEVADLVDAFVTRLNGEDTDEAEVPAEITDNVVASPYTQTTGEYTLRILARSPGISFSCAVSATNGSGLGVGVLAIQTPIEAVNEQQLITLSGSPTGGTFTLTYAGETTGALDFDATAAEVETELEGLSSIGANNVAVTAVASGGWLVTFQGDFEGEDVALLSADGSSLTGQTGYITHATTANGSPGTNEVRTLTLTRLQPGATSATGYLQVVANGISSGSAAFTAHDSDTIVEPAAATVRSLLEACFGVGNVEVTRTHNRTTHVMVYTITFVNDYAGQDIGELSWTANFGGSLNADEMVTLTDATVTDGTSDATDEVQTIRINHSPTGGTFTLSLDGQTTGAIDYDATAAEVKTAIDALSNVTSVTVTKTGALYTVTFDGDPGEAFGQMTSSSSLTGSRVNTVVEREAVAAVPPRTVITLSGSPTGGTFSLTYGGVETDALDYNATAQEVEDALNAIVEPTHYGGAAASTAPGGGEPAWQNTANVLAESGTAHVDLGMDEASEYLDVDQMGFAVPSTATITGAQILVIAHQTLATVVEGIRATLFDATGTPSAWNTQEESTLLVEDTPTLYTIGTTTENFGLTLTPTMVNDPDFGARIQIVSGGAGGGSAYITSIRIKIYYSVNGIPFSQEVTVTGNNGGPWTVTGENGGIVLEILEGDNNLTGTGTEGITATTITESTGPNDWENPDNWSTGAVPVDGDDVYFENSDISVRYNLDQSGVLLSSLNIAQTYSGKIGALETESFVEKELQIGATSLNIGGGRDQGEGSSLIRINTGTDQTTIHVANSGRSEKEGLSAIQWRGTHASNALTITRGEFTAAGYAGETATLATVTLGTRGEAVDGDLIVELGRGVTLSGLLQVHGGELYSKATAGGAVIQTGGVASFFEAVGVTGAAEISGGSMIWLSSGGFASTVDVSGAGSLDFGQDPRARTITGQATVHKGGTFLDPQRSITFTVATGLKLHKCALADVTVDLGADVSLARTNN